VKSVKKSTPKPKPTQKDKQFLRVGFLFFSSVIVLHFLVWYLSGKQYLASFDIFTSYVIANLIQLTGLSAIRYGNTIQLAHSSWIIVSECTALSIMVVFSSFVFVYPASIKSKGLALVAGLPFIFAANILRLLCMAWIDFLKPQYSEFFHDYLWQVAFIVMVVFMWLVWIDKVVNRETKISVAA